MSPYLTVRDIYIRHQIPGSMTWEESVGWYLAEPGAYVHKTPDYFIMARPVVKAAGAMILNPVMRFPLPLCDTWFLFAFAGDHAKAWRELPYPLPWFCWQKANDPENDLRFLPAAAIRRLSGNG